jgi:RNA polymerase sigma factor (sigma-70 family)
MLAATSPTILPHRDGRSVTQSEAPQTDFTQLVCNIRAGDVRSIEELYRLLNPGLRFLFSRAIASVDFDDIAHDAFVVVVDAIRSGRIRDSEALMAYARSVVRNKLTGHRRELARKRCVSVEVAGCIRDRSDTPEDRVIAQERVELMHRTLADLTARDREILTRFYVLGHSPEQIMNEMELTATQFRLLKWRAKTKFAALAQHSLRKPVRSVTSPVAVKVQ